MKIRIAGTVNDSIVDGPGFRFTVFTQGCPHHCEGCHNQHTHDFNGGYECDTQELIDKIKANPLLDGVTLSGGEPMCQAKALIPIARSAKEIGLNVIVYTGYLFEFLVQNSDADNGYANLLKYVDFIVDGKFELDKRSLELRFRGSKNQRVIDVQKSLEQGVTVETEFE